MNTPTISPNDGEREALLPCPFCGHETPEFERMGTSGQSCIVVCGNCGARHESSDEYLRSGTSWNERATLAAASPDGAGVPVARAYVDGNDVCRELRWAPDQPSFDLPVGTKLYAIKDAVIDSSAHSISEDYEHFLAYTCKVPAEERLRLAYEHGDARGRTTPQPEPSVQPPAEASSRHCNKCGYFGTDELHKRPTDGKECNYLSAPTNWQALATPQPPAPVVPLTEVGNGHADYCEALKYEGSECSCSGVSVPATVPLTTERIDAIWHGMGSFTSNDHRIFARAIEAAHKIGDKP